MGASAAVAAALVAVLLRAPAWLSLVLLVIGAGLTVVMLVMGGVDRALAPLVLTALALGLIVPSGVQVVRSARIAPPKGTAQQKLPTGKVVLETAPREPIELTVEVASTDPERQRGLMFREELKEGEGMLFIFPDGSDHTVKMFGGF